LDDPIIVEELALLEKVKAALEQLPDPKQASHAPLVRELERLREVMLSGEEGKDAPALQEQYNHQSAVLEQLRSAGRQAKVDPESPYFAHMRLLEDNQERDLCLGRATCLAKGVRIIDWRDAPISKIFYRYKQGEDYDEEISGRERIGELSVRRMVRIRDGALERIQTPEGDFVVDPGDASRWTRREVEQFRLTPGAAAPLQSYGEDEGLERRLGSDETGRAQRADKHLPEITGLIDPSQFDLITRPSAGFLVIRGSAGSGKTTVALHRVAYLAFDDPRIDSPDTLVVMFSRALRNYVSHVLPSLGLSRVRIVTYPEWVAKERKRHFPGLPERVRDNTPAVIQRIKLHPILMIALERQVARVPGQKRWEQALDDFASVLTQPELLTSVRDEVAPNAFSDAEIDRFVAWNRERLDELYTALAGDKESPADFDPEDNAILVRAYQLRVGRLKTKKGAPQVLRHVVLDEVQDFSPLEVQVLIDCLGSKPSITLAGDTQQHVMQNSGFTSWEEFFHYLGVEGTTVDTLKISYRSSHEIVDFAYSLLGDLQEDGDAPETTRTGPPVEFFQFGHRGACVAFLGDALRELVDIEPNASIAVLTPSPALSIEYYDGLKRSEIYGLRMVENEEFSFKAGIEICDIEQVKGLEFDYVILVEVDVGHFPNNESARRLLHVGATRAIHQLWLMSVASPSPLLARLVGSGAHSA
jgi:DNA helicase-2/ATP-dependent DNA helicase PcrA